MRQVLIVDDGTIVRIALHPLVDWRTLGYQIVADAIHGEQALIRLREHPVDLVITDVKMPMVDGIGLPARMNHMVSNRELPVMPKILVLSNYDDFNLVRESFRLGAGDYLLRAGLNETMLETVLRRLDNGWQGNEDRQGGEAGQNSTGSGARQNGADSGGQQEGTHVPEVERGQFLTGMAMGKRDIQPEFFSGDYTIIQFKIKDFIRHSSRFDDDMREGLVKPVPGFTDQIPRVVFECVLGSVSPSRHVMLYQVGDRNMYQNAVLSTCRQLCSIWSSYMNLLVSCGVSSTRNGTEEFAHRFTEAGNQLALHCLKGKTQVYLPWEKGCVRYEDMMETEEEYEELLKGLLVGNELAVDEEKTRLFTACYQEGPERARLWCLYLICQLAWRLLKNYNGIGTLFADEVNYYKKLGRLNDVRSLEVWMNNYFHWMTDHMQHHYNRKQADMMAQAKRFIIDDYANPELTLGNVAGYIGLNEKYFSPRFTKEEGMTSSDYPMEMRIRKAKELIEQTDSETYGVSRSVDYSSMEHFTRVFRKLCHVSPGGYRK